MQINDVGIRRLCEWASPFPDGISRTMIHPFVPQKVVHRGASYGLSSCSYDIRLGCDVTLPPGRLVLAHSLEDFAIPLNVAAYVVDKSTLARRGVSAFNTLFDPGFVGNATLELVNHSDQTIEMLVGDPVCQIVFHWLDGHTSRPYSGKYQHQPKRPVPAIMEPGAL